MDDALDRTGSFSAAEVRRNPGPTLLAVLLVVAAVAVVVFFAFGGALDEGDEGSGDVRAPTVEVEQPDVGVQANRS
jgi:hypothetical protein